MNDRKGVIDYDSLVVDFLRRQEKAGGNAMAVALVLDTDGLVDREEETQSPNPRPGTTPSRGAQHRHHHHRVELGFAIHGAHRRNLAGEHTILRQNSLELQSKSNTNATSTTKKEHNQTNAVECRQWPAVYLRSSMRLNTPARGNTATASRGGMGLISGMRRNASAARGSGSALDGKTPSQHSMHVSSSRTSVDGSPGSKYRKSDSTRRCSLLSHGNVFEYETEPSERPSWPHSEWGQLRTLLDEISSGTWTANIETDHGSTPSPSPTRGDDAKAHSSLFGEQSLAFTVGHPESENQDGTVVAEGIAIGASDTRGSIFSSEFGKQLWDPLPTTLPPGGGTSSSTGHTSSNAAPTTFHAVSLNSFMWIIGTLRCL